MDLMDRMLDHDDEVTRVLLQEASPSPTTASMHPSTLALGPRLR
ncbi:MAG: hypothetical protein ACP5QO_09635 [Clostridia bacterium]